MRDCVYDRERERTRDGDREQDRSVKGAVGIGRKNDRERNVPFLSQRGLNRASIPSRRRSPLSSEGLFFVCQSLCGPGPVPPSISRATAVFQPHRQTEEKLLHGVLGWSDQPEGPGWVERERERGFVWWNVKC